jgi:hypothetical protein
MSIFISDGTLDRTFGSSKQVTKIELDLALLTFVITQLFVY